MIKDINERSYGAKTNLHNFLVCLVFSKLL